MGYAPAPPTDMERIKEEMFRHHECEEFRGLVCTSEFIEYTQADQLNTSPWQLYPPTFPGSDRVAS